MACGRQAYIPCDKVKLGEKSMAGNGTYHDEGKMGKTKIEPKCDEEIKEAMERELARLKTISNRKEADRLMTGKIPEPEGINPKDLIGAKKVDLSLVPSAGIIGMARCMMNGAKKYGPYNWREEGKPVQTMTYLSAAMRHLLAYIDGEDKAQDSGENHLDHIMAGLAVLRDAQACGNCIDNRPIKGAAARLIDATDKT